MWGCRERERCECECEGVGGRRTVSVGVQGEGEVCVVVRGREGEVCVVGQWRPKTAVKKYRGVEGGRSVHGDGEVCVWSVWGECMCVNVNVCTV